MKYKCCDHILGSIDLSFSGFKYCNEVWEGPEYISYKEENAFDKNEQRRLKIIEEMKNNTNKKKNIINASNYAWEEKGNSAKNVVDFLIETQKELNDGFNI